MGRQPAMPQLHENPSQSLFLAAPLDSSDCGESDCCETSESVPSVYHSSVYNIPCSNQDNQIKNDFDWSQIDNTPVNEFKTPEYIPCAFPTLFPRGKADLRSHRLKTVTPANYFKHLMNYHDDRFAPHPTFRYFALNTIMRWNSLTTGNIFVKKNEGLDNVSVEQLKDMLKQDPTLIKKIMFYASNLRGTNAYWYARCNELKDMVEQSSLPAFFLTLSAADLHWKDLFRLLTEKDVDQLSERERRDLLQQNPMIVDNFFDLRVKAFIKEVSKNYQTLKVL